MLYNYLKSAIRSLGKNKLYTLINIAGLTVGIAVALLIGIYISEELNYDKFHANGGRIVRATMEYSKGGTVNTTATTGTRVGPQFKRMFPAVEAYVRTFIGHNIVKAGDEVFEEPRILYADPAFFQVFSFKLLEGNASTVLDAADKVVISQAIAKKYFGKGQAVGQVLVSGGKNLRVSGVYEDVPQNSQLKFDLVTPFLNLGNGVETETFWNANWITYFLLKDEPSVSRFSQQVNAYMQSAPVRTEAGMEGRDYLTIHLEPLAWVHLHSPLNGFEPNGSIRYIYMFGVIALLVLVIACANYTNLSAAQAAGRSGEIGMRKVLGASRKQLFLQFIGESSVLTMFAAVVALLLSLALIPSFNSITGKQFSAAMLLKPLPLFSLFLLSVVIAFFAGLYPAVVLSGARMMGILKKPAIAGSGQNMRRALIVVQFAISVFLISYTAIVLRQMRFMQTKNLGYEKDHVIVLPVGGNMMDHFQNIKEAFLQVKGVEGVTASYETPEYVEWGDGITAVDEKGRREISLNAMPVDLDFTSTLKMQMVAGRDFKAADFALADTSVNPHPQQAYMLNETLARMIGWKPEDAIGKTIEKGVPGPVVGVVKDFNFSSLHEPIGPLLIFLGRDYTRDLMIRVGGDVPTVTAGIEKAWNQYVPGRPFNFHFLDDDYNRLYLAEQRTAALFSVASAIAIVLACLGLFALAAFTTLQRTREIGIRRVLGASTGSIALLITNNFLKPVGLAILTAIPLAWWAGDKWLQDFAFRAPLNTWIFLATAAFTVLIAVCTVGYHSVKAAMSNPVKSLRTE